MESVRFVHLTPLSEEQVQKAVASFANVDAATGRDLFLYLDCHFYVLRNDVMDTFRILTHQAEKEGHPGAPRLTPRWEVLKEARRIVSAGGIMAILGRGTAAAAGDPTGNGPA